MKLLERIRHKFVRDAVTLQVGALFNAFGNFISAALLAHLLGAEVQGQFYVAVSLYSLLWVFVNQGLLQATVSQVAAANSRGQHEKVAYWLAWLLKASLIFGCALAVLGFLTLPTVAEWWLDSDRKIGWWAAWMALSPLLDTPRIVACAAMQGTRRMLPFAQAENAMEAIRVFLVIVGALVTNSAVGPVVGTLAASLLGSIVATELYRRDRKLTGSPLPSLALIRRYMASAPIMHGTRLGVKLGIVRNLNALCMEIVPSLLIERFGSSEWVAYMRIAQRLMRVPLMFMQGISRTALPMFSEKAGLKDMAGLRRAFVKASVVSGLVITCGIIVVLPFLPWILRLAFPAAYLDPVYSVCLILVPGFIIMSFSIANDTFYLVTNTLRVAVIISVVGMFISVAMLFALARWNPTTGVAWGLTINMACSALHLIYAWWYFRKHAKDRLPPPASIVVPS
ncbi:MAG: oligosaccharide flippase family protein [Planctomycetes bacterium]|nr:oligosaccharide flippase family protein [Planctomycetota bacterium]